MWNNDVCGVCVVCLCALCVLGLCSLYMWIYVHMWLLREVCVWCVKILRTWLLCHECVVCLWYCVWCKCVVLEVCDMYSV